MTNFNHVLHFEDELTNQLKFFTDTNPEKVDPIVMAKIAVFVDIDKQLSIIADSLENIERRLELDQNNTSN